MSPKIAFFFSRVFPLIFLTIGLVALSFGLRGVLRARESADWPGVPGQITASAVEQHRSTSRDNGSSRTHWTYHAEIQYQYSIDGQSYVGDRVAYGDYGSDERGHAEEIVARYPVGAEVKVFHRPNEPDESLLEPGLKGQAWLLPGLGAFFALIGGVVAVVLPRVMRRHAGAQASTQSASSPEA